MIPDTPVLHHSNNTEKKKRDEEDMYCTVGVVKSKSLPSSITEKLIRMWVIGLKTATNILDATIHKFISSTGLLEIQF